MEIERKFLVAKIPDLSRIPCVRSERYYLYAGKGVELRVQSKGKSYELERLEETSELGRNKTKVSISKAEFGVLKKLAKYELSRDNYKLSKNISLKVYHGDFEGLVRAEVEFSSEKEAKAYVPEVWMGEEVTKTALGRDSKLMKLNKKEFHELLTSVKNR